MDFEELYNAVKPHNFNNMEQEYKDSRIEALSKRVKELEDSLNHANQTIDYLIINFKNTKNNE